MKFLNRFLIATCVVLGSYFAKQIIGFEMTVIILVVMIGLGFEKHLRIIRELLGEKLH